MSQSVSGSTWAQLVGYFIGTAFSFIDNLFSIELFDGVLLGNIIVIVFLLSFVSFLIFRG